MARAALLPLVHTGLAIYYDAGAGRFVAHQLANSVPAPATRPWLEAYTAGHPLQRAPGTMLPETGGRSGVPDQRAGEMGEKGFGATFPHDPQATKHPNDAVFAMPLGNDLEFDLAEATIDGEQLGADRTPDLLVISLSAHDYVGHGWGHESEEQWDMELRLGRRGRRALRDPPRRRPRAVPDVRSRALGRPLLPARARLHHGHRGRAGGDRAWLDPR